MYAGVVDVSQLSLMVSRGETREVEFKNDFDEAIVVQAVVCLANGNGGHLLVGVKDNGEIVGIRARKKITTKPRRIESLIANKTEPPVRTSAQVVGVEGVKVLVIEVPRAEHVVSTRDGRYLWRTVDVQGKPQCLPMSPHEVMQRADSISEHDYSKAPLPELSFDDLSQVELHRFRELSEDGGDRAVANLSDEDLLKALSLVTLSGSLTVGALLLFGKQSAIRRWLPHYEVAFHELSNREEVQANVSGPFPLLKASEDLVKEVMVRNREEEIYVNVSRIALPLFSHFAVRELVANALVHRDYRAAGPTVVRLQADVLAISNPGGLPAGVGLANLLTVPPRPRNPALADAFKRAGIVERTSRGISRAYAEQLSLGRSAPDYSRSVLDSVIVRVKAGSADKALASLIAEEQQNGKDFALDDLLAFHEIRSEKRITAARAAELFQVEHNEARQKLDDLAIRGYVAPRGYGKGRSYRLSAELYKKLGESADFIWVSGFDALQQEQLVMSYVGVNGSIARQDAAEVCRIDAATAGRLLRRLRDEGKLVLVGAKRGARYVLPSRSASRSGY